MRTLYMIYRNVLNCYIKYVQIVHISTTYKILLVCLILWEVDNVHVSENCPT